MKQKLFAILAISLPLSAWAAHYDIKMLNVGSEGTMVFEPGYLKAEVGDTVTFKTSTVGHSVQSKAVPDGAREFTGEMDEEITVRLEKEGVYVYTCPPHRMMNMNGVIQVGKPVNMKAAQAAADDLEKRAMQNKGRLQGYMQKIR